MKALLVLIFAFAAQAHAEDITYTLIPHQLFPAGTTVSVAKATDWLATTSSKLTCEGIDIGGDKVPEIVRGNGRQIEKTAAVKTKNGQISIKPQGMGGWCHSELQGTEVTLLFRSGDLPERTATFTIYNGRGDQIQSGPFHTLDCKFVTVTRTTSNRLEIPFDSINIRNFINAGRAEFQYDTREFACLADGSPESSSMAAPFGSGAQIRINVSLNP